MNKLNKLNLNNKLHCILCNEQFDKNTLKHTCSFREYFINLHIKNLKIKI